jgi:glycosyltransferase involved in cell wall biosynthesis
MNSIRLNREREKLPGLSALFPAYNEIVNIGNLVQHALDVFPAIAERFEIIVVDDGSTDATAAAVEELIQLHPEVRLIGHRENHGYGAALRTGFASAREPIVFFTDGDGQFDIGEIDRLVPLLDSSDIVAGYRLKRRDPIVRSVNACFFNLLIRALFGLNHRDINCAFKLIKRDVLDAISLTSKGALINAEVLLKARRAGFIISQIGVHHYPRPVGRQTGADLSVVFRMFREVYGLWLELKTERSRSPKKLPSRESC